MASGKLLKPRVAKVLASSLAAVYVVISVVFLLLNALGLSPSGQLAYLFTWDMFPGFQTESVRRVAVGQTDDGRYVLLHPSFGQQFREGLSRDMSRAELDRSGSHFLQLAKQAARRSAQAGSIRRILLFEQYWPCKYNFSDSNFERFTGMPKRKGLLELPSRDDLLSPPAGVPHASWRQRDSFEIHSSAAAP